MSGITIVIPTLLKTDKVIFQFSLDQYCQNEHVEKIIIIDNTTEDRFNKEYNTPQQLPKVCVLNPSDNLGASCNAGMELCDTKYYLLLNDDLICTSEVIDHCFEIIEAHPVIGLLQMATINHQPFNIYLERSNSFKFIAIPKFFIPTNPGSTMSGWFQFGRTELWEPIPADLKNFGGDDLNLLRIKKMGYKVAIVTSVYISHMKATTVNALGGLHKEHLEQAEIYRNIAKGIK